MIGINLHGFIPKFLSGGWTSEDIDNPVYSKKKPLSIKELEELIIKDRLKLGVKDFDKAAKIGLGLVRLHPTYGIAMSIIDATNELKKAKEGNASFNDELNYTSNFMGAMGKGMYKAGNKDWKANTYKNIVRRNHAMLGNPLLMGLGLMFGGLDYLLDIKDLYNTITE